MSESRVRLDLRESTGILAFSDSFEIIHTELQGDRIVLTLQDDQCRRGALSVPVSAVFGATVPEPPERLLAIATASRDRVLLGTVAPVRTPRPR